MQLSDRFNRTVDYLRISVTDRCDFRCVYCMSEEMTFLPKKEILSLEEIHTVCQAFTELGVNKIRLTGGEPLIRPNIGSLFESVGNLDGLNELLVTTNGSRLTACANDLKQAGVNRINVSLDSLDADKFNEITRTGKLETVIAGIDAAKAAGIERIKINSVILKGRNDEEILPLIEFIRDRVLDISFIEEMPLGNISEHDRANTFMASEEIRNIIGTEYPLTAIKDKTGGPSRYFKMTDSDCRVGFISPHSENFCSTCNRVRVTVEGRLLLCLGNEHSVDLKAVMRSEYDSDELRLAALKQTIIDAMDIKPERHYFDLDEEPQVLRFMNTTGG